MARILSGSGTETRDLGEAGAAPPSEAEKTVARRALQTALAAHGAGAPPPPSRWVDYLALLLRWRKRRNIAGPSEPAELAVEALVDTRFVDRVVPRSGALFDVGSGAGFPGIPLAALESERRVTLVEPSPPRAALLRLAAATLELPVRILALRGERLAEDIEAGREAAADVAVARAFRSPEEWLALARRLLRPGGVAIVLATRGWQGPSEDSTWVTDERLDYELRGRKPRTAWRLRPAQR